MAIVIKSTEVKKVKNLGWLLKNWKLVDRIEVYSIPTESELWPNLSFDDDVWDGGMAAYLRDGRIYFTHWASLTVCKKWLHRPVFRGLPLKWLGEDTYC